jgi:hypothetical protein
MSEPPDLDRIKPAATPPPDQPDPQTQAEVKEYRQKAPTPLEREAQAHSAHIAELRARIELHCSELTDQKGKLDAERQEAKQLAIRNAHLEEIAHSVSWLTLIGNLLSLLGGAAIGIGGAAPSLSDTAKGLWTGAGIGLVAGGATLTVLGVAVGKRSR